MSCFVVRVQRAQEKPGAALAVTGTRTRRRCLPGGAAGTAFSELEPQLGRVSLSIS